MGYILEKAFLIGWSIIVCCFVYVVVGLFTSKPFHHKSLPWSADEALCECSTTDLHTSDSPEIDISSQQKQPLDDVSKTLGYFVAEDCTAKSNDSRSPVGTVDDRMIIEEVKKRKSVESMKEESPLDSGCLVTESGVEPKSSSSEDESSQFNLDLAIERKNIGNDLARDGKYKEAIDSYESALEVCPKEESTVAAILFANAAQMCLNLEDYGRAVEYATSAIELDVNFTKAYLRRSRAFKALDQLSNALGDLEKALTMDPTLADVLRMEKSQLKKEVDAQMEKEKAEMIGKLKDFGNWALGKVGMSIDDFKVVQDPNTGSYNIQYNPKDSTN